MTEAAIMKGLNWLKSVQDEDGGWGKKDKDDQGKTVTGQKASPVYRDAMTGMALLAYLGSLRTTRFSYLWSNSPKGH
jgi:squalene cyclase